MFPFNYIPENLSPTIREIITILIIVQFIAFAILMLTLIYEFCTTKKEKKEEIKDKKEEPKENNKVEENNVKEKEKSD